MTPLVPPPPPPCVVCRTEVTSLDDLERLGALGGAAGSAGRGMSGDLDGVMVMVRQGVRRATGMRRGGADVGEGEEGGGGEADSGGLGLFAAGSSSEAEDGGRCGGDSVSSSEEGVASECSVNWTPPVLRTEPIGARESSGDGRKGEHEEGDAGLPSGAEGGKVRGAEASAAERAERRRRRQRRMEKRAAREAAGNDGGGNGDASSSGSTDTYILGEYYGFGAVRPSLAVPGPRIRVATEALAAAHHDGAAAAAAAAGEGGDSQLIPHLPGRLTTEIGKPDLRSPSAAAAVGTPPHDAAGSMVHHRHPTPARPPVPDCFLCPLTLEVGGTMGKGNRGFFMLRRPPKLAIPLAQTAQVFRNPVVAADGVTYEEEAILRHFATFSAKSLTSISSSQGLKGGEGAGAPTPVLPSATSPLTKQRLPYDGCTHTFPNRALKQAIEYWAATNNIKEMMD